MADVARKPSPERRERVLDAARFLALRHGLRGVTMQAIAREARIAKPTLYAYFPDKDAVFVAVMDDLIAQMRDGVSQALAAPGSAAERIAAALAAKYLASAKLLEGSAHADELFSAHDRVAGPQFAAFELWVTQALGQTLNAAGVAEPESLAKLLIDAAYGVGMRTRPLEAIGPAVALVTERLLAPEIKEI